MSEPPPLLTAVESLVGVVDRVVLPLPLPSRDDARTVRRQLVDQAHDHLVPRIADRDAPLLVVIGGSTGAGKSTLVNTLVGEEVSETGVLRPTTRSPVLVHHPGERGWFEGDRILPSLARNSGRQGTAADVLTLVGHDAVPSGIALLDAPDVDSVDDANRQLSRQLLAAADLWLFCTTPSRYADAVPWELLRTASARGTSLAVVLGKVGDEQRDEVPAHLRRMLDDAGLAQAALLVVDETTTADGLLPATAVTSVRDHLDALAGDAARRRAVADRTLRGGLDSLTERVGVVRSAHAEQLAATDDLRAVVAGAHDGAIDTVRDAIDDGRVLRGEVLARWHDFVGAGDLLRRLEEGVGRLRDRVASLWRGSRRTDEPLTDALGDGLVAVVVDALENAHAETLRAWRTGAGRMLTDAGDPPPRTTQAAVRTGVQRWQDDVVELVREQAGDKRASARMVALGLNGVAAALMVAVFASTGGLTGAEVGVAGGTSVVAQRLLEAVLGDQAVRSLTAQARDSLVREVRGLVDAQQGGFTSRLDGLGLDPDTPVHLDEAVAALAAARRRGEL